MARTTMAKSKVTLLDGTEFDSQIAACRHFGVNEATFFNRKRAGLTVEQCLGIETFRPCRRTWANGGLKNENNDLIDSPMLNLYKITNTINGKIYIGITIGTIEDRLKHHLIHARNLQNKTRLCRAIRKYGERYFFIELLRNDAIGSKQLQDQEIETIRTSNSKNPSIGYNMNDGGSTGKTVSVTIDDVTYSSNTSAAAAFGIRPDTLKNRLRYGWTMKQALGIDKSKIYPYEFEGHCFRNLNEACKHYGINSKTLHYRRSLGMTIEEAFAIVPSDKMIKKRKPVSAFGKSYPSLRSCAIANGITNARLVSRLKNHNEDVETAIQHLKGAA